MSLPSCTSSSKKALPLLKPVCTDAKCVFLKELGDRHYLSVCKRAHRINKVETVFQVAEEDIPRVMGRNGSMIRSICEDNCVKVSLDKDTCLLEIKGLAWNVKQAEEEVRCILNAPQAFKEHKELDAISDISTAPTEPGERTELKVEKNSHPPALVLTALERKELLKVEKTLRQLDAIQRSLDEGKTVDRLQLEKLQRRGELESSVVMLKIKGGYQRE